MRYFNLLIRNAFEDFRKNKAKTVSTSLGIMIGVLSVVMLIAIGLGLKNYLKNQFENLGSNLLIVFPGSGFGSGGGGIGGAFTSLAGGISFDERDYHSLQKVRSAEYVVPDFIDSTTISSNTEEKSGSLQGVSEDFFTIFNMELLGGKFFDKSDVTSSSKNGVMAETLARDLFGNPKDAVGKTVKAKKIRIKIIGVVKNIGDPEQDRSVMIPYTTTFGSINPDKNFFSIYLAVKNDNEVLSAKKEAEDILLKRYQSDQFSVIEPSQILDSLNQIFSILNAVLVAIGSISLVVGGIGIMNIMYANVTERTKEIGIRRAIGATKMDILLQFLTESILLSLFGGVTGLAIATGIVLLVQPFFPMAINALAVELALGVSTLIGVVFGVFPARRASNLTPIEAIRYE